MRNVKKVFVGLAILATLITAGNGGRVASAATCFPHNMDHISADRVRFCSSHYTPAKNYQGLPLYDKDGNYIYVKCEVITYQEKWVVICLDCKEVWEEKWIETVRHLNRDCPGYTG